MIAADDAYNQRDQICPACAHRGKPVPLLTLKALLLPRALVSLDTAKSYYICTEAHCEIVYFSGTLAFSAAMIKVPLLQKDASPHVPVCYCLGLTREKLSDVIDQGENPVEQIRLHQSAGRCACEIHNPQGACCLGNVTRFMKKQLREKEK